MRRALKVCSTPDCPALVPAGRCDECDREADRRRGTPAERGYGGAWSTWSRAYVRRHPLCEVQGPRCTGTAVLPDHHPTSRRDLVASGVINPDQDQYVRPSCRRCHSVETAAHQPGGWAARS